MSDWKPLAEAKKDGTPYLFYDPFSSKKMVIGKWQTWSGEPFWGEIGAYRRLDNVTLCRECPDPPTEDEIKQSIAVYRAEAEKKYSARRKGILS